MPSPQPALTCRGLEVRASRGFLRHRSSFVSSLCQAGVLALAARQPAGTGGAQIRWSIAPKGRCCMKTLRWGGGALLVTLRRGHTTGMKSKVHPTYKTKYRVANWPAYNRALVRRGAVTVWLSSEAIAAWTPRRSGRRGGQRRYSDLAIETALTLRLLYHLPLRQAEGFLHALFGMMRLDLSAPD